jgi:hypothetical protein
MTKTTRNDMDKMEQGVSTMADFPTYFNSNMDIIDATIGKSNLTAVSDPTVNDDEGDGYVVGSLWLNVDEENGFICSDATASAAKWNQIYPSATDAGDVSGPASATANNFAAFDGSTGKLIKDSTYNSSTFAVAAKGVTNGDSHDHVGGDGAAIVIGPSGVTFAATAKVLGRKTASGGAGEELSPSDVLDLVGTAEQGDVLYRGASAWALLPHGTSGQLLQSGGNAANPSWVTPSAGGASFWTTMPGTPTRVSDTQFTITDTGNANIYDKTFVKGTILKWLESTTFNTAMIISASYSTDAVTINVVGDSLTAGFTDMKYCIHHAQLLEFILPGGIGTGTDLGRTNYAYCDLIKLSVDARVKTAGTTNATVIDINDDGTTIITTKPSIASGGTSDIDNVCDAPTTVIAMGSAITIDVDSVSTTPPQDLYAILYVYPEAWRYMA